VLISSHAAGLSFGFRSYDWAGLICDGPAGIYGLAGFQRRVFLLGVDYRHPYDLFASRASSEHRA